MSNCQKNSDKTRILSSCEKPVYTNLCNTEVFEEIRDAVINNTAVLKAEIDEMQSAVTTAIGDIIATIDDGIEVTATQKGVWHVTVDNPTDLDALATKIADALDNLNVTIAGQAADLNVNVTNDKLVVTVDNFPTPTDYTALLEAIRDKDNTTDLTATNALIQTLIEKQTNADNYAEQSTTQTITGTNIIVTFFEGTGTFTLNGGTPVSLDSTKQYRSEPMDGTVIITPDTGAKYHVSWRA